MSIMLFYFINELLIAFFFIMDDRLHRSCHRVLMIIQYNHIQVSHDIRNV